ncbi:MAG: hypothetical protein QNJ97_18930 [Myxococcota bacterium]|nr:hypothetical protein [Myxococcota bacterium]
MSNCHVAFQPFIVSVCCRLCIGIAACGDLDPSHESRDALLKVDNSGTIFAHGNQIVRQSASGDIVTLYESKSFNTRLRLEQSANGRFSGVYEQDRLLLYNSVGRPIGAVAITYPEFRHKLIGSEPKVLIPITDIWGDGEIHINGFDVRNSDGSSFAQIRANRTRFSHASNEHITVATNRAVSRFAMDGTTAWRFSIHAHKLAVAANADYTEIVPTSNARTIIHLSNGKAIGQHSFSGPLWNIAVSPNGLYSAATTQTQLYLFLQGMLIQTIDLSVAYAVSLAVNDKGDTVVGGQTASHHGRVLLYDVNGSKNRAHELERDDHAFSPAVKFFNGGARYFFQNAKAFSSAEVRP